LLLLINTKLSLSARANIVNPPVKVLSEFSDEQRAQFLQFTWARSRLPSEMGTYRMQIFIIETKHDHSRDRSLPTSETCFFNVNLPHYSSIDILRQKLLQALECCTITS